MSGCCKVFYKNHLFFFFVCKSFHNYLLTFLDFRVHIIFCFDPCVVPTACNIAPRCNSTPPRRNTMQAPQTYPAPFVPWKAWRCFPLQNGLNALHLAAKEGHMDLVEELLERGAAVNSPTKVHVEVALTILKVCGNERIAVWSLAPPWGGGGVIVFAGGHMKKRGRWMCASST